MRKLSNKKLLQLEISAKKSASKLTHITDKTQLSMQDRVKIGLCRHFVQFSVENRMKNKDLAKLIQAPETRVSEITNYKISKFTVDKLLEYLSELSKHDPKVREYSEFFGRAAELPILKVATTRELSRGLDQASAYI